MTVKSKCNTNIENKTWKNTSLDWYSS